MKRLNSVCDLDRCHPDRRVLDMFGIVAYVLHAEVLSRSRPGVRHDVRGELFQTSFTPSGDLTVEYEAENATADAVPNLSADKPDAGLPQPRTDDLDRTRASLGLCPRVRKNGAETKSRARNRDCVCGSISSAARLLDLINLLRAHSRNERAKLQIARAQPRLQCRNKSSARSLAQARHAKRDWRGWSVFVAVRAKTSTLDTGPRAHAGPAKERKERHRVRGS